MRRLDNYASAVAAQAPCRRTFSCSCSSRPGRSGHGRLTVRLVRVGLALGCQRHVLKLFSLPARPEGHGATLSFELLENAIDWNIGS